MPLLGSGLDWSIGLDEIHDQEPVTWLQRRRKSADDIGGILVRMIEKALAIKISVSECLLWLKEIVDFERDSIVKLCRDNAGCLVSSHGDHFRSILDNKSEFGCGLGDGDGAVAHMPADIDHGAGSEGTPVESVLDVDIRRRRLPGDCLDRGSESSLSDWIGADEVVEWTVASVGKVDGSLIGLL